MGRLSEDEAVAPKSLLEQMCSFIINKYLVVSNAFPVSGTLITCISSIFFILVDFQTSAGFVSYD